MSRDVQADIRYIRKNAPPGAGLAGKYKKSDPDMTMDYYKKARHLLTDEKVITFQDARTTNGGLGSWDFNKHGLTFMTPPPAIDFDDSERVKEEYYPQLAELVKKVTGCKDCFVNSHLLRMPNPPTIFQNPAKFAHCDASKEFPPRWHKDLIKQRGLTEEESNAVDICSVNVWHPRDIPAWKDPLCLLDVSTVDLENEVCPIPSINLHGEMNTKFPPLVGPCYSPKHRWVYISDQKPDEAWLFKQWDEREGVARSCFHNSFVDPMHLNDPSKPGRRSVEFRMYLTFPRKNAGATSKL